MALATVVSLMRAGTRYDSNPTRKIRLLAHAPILFPIVSSRSAEPESGPVNHR
jgi:hypothetical protein